MPVLQTDSGTVIGNSPFILDFLLGHPLHTAEQTATAAFAFSLLDQLVKLFGLQKFKAENTPDHPLTERARAACIRGLAAAPPQPRQPKRIGTIHRPRRRARRVAGKLGNPPRHLDATAAGFGLALSASPLTRQKAT